MSDQGQQLLRAILLAPQDELARLAYADWCEQEGDARQQFHAGIIRQELHQKRILSVPTYPDLARIEPTICPANWYQGFIHSLTVLHLTALYYDPLLGLFSRHPVVFVTLPGGAVPYMREYSGGWETWCWMPQDDEPPFPHHIPPPIWPYLIDRHGPRGPSYALAVAAHSRTEDPTHTEAIWRLSAALINYARAQHTLPPLYDGPESYGTAERLFRESMTPNIRTAGRKRRPPLP